jgi:hypothetical protein
MGLLDKKVVLISGTGGGLGQLPSRTTIQLSRLRRNCCESSYRSTRCFVSRYIGFTDARRAPNFAGKGPME